MKKFLVLFISLFAWVGLSAQTDTTVVKKPVYFETEQIVSKSGKSYTKYYAVIDGKYYDSNKTSMERYYLIKRFYGEPCVILITTGKTKHEKILVL